MGMIMLVTETVVAATTTNIANALIATCGVALPNLALWVIRKRKLLGARN